MGRGWQSAAGGSGAAAEELIDSAGTYLYPCHRRKHGGIMKDEGHDYGPGKRSRRRHWR